MLFSEPLANNPDSKPPKNNSKNKMIKSRHTHSQKTSFKTSSFLSHKLHSEITYHIKTPNSLIKDKYFKPAIKQYQRADANVITRCIQGQFDDFEDKTMELYEFVKFYSLKQNLRKYESGILDNFKDKFTLISPITYFKASINRHIFHFYDKSFHILKNRSIKLKNLLIQSSILKTQKGSWIKNGERKKGSKSKSKQKLKRTDNLLKGIFSINLSKSPQKSAILTKIKKIHKLPLSRKTHAVSKDTQDMNHLVEELQNILKAYCIEGYSETSTEEETASPQNEFSRTISVISGITSTEKRSRIKEIAKQNELTEIMQNQYSHISAIKNSQIVPNTDHFEFYGLSAIKQKKVERQLKNSTKNQSYFANIQRSINNESRLTDKKVPNLQYSSIFTEQTPKKQAPHKIYDLKEKDDETKKSKSNSKTLRKGLQEKSKSKSLSSTQKSLKKDPSAPFTFKNTKLLTNAKSMKNLPERLLFMEPLNQKQVRKPTLFFTLKGQDRKDSKSKSKGKMLLQRNKRFD